MYNMACAHACHVGERVSPRGYGAGGGGGAHTRSKKLDRYHDQPVLRSKSSTRSDYRPVSTRTPGEPPSSRRAGWQLRHRHTFRPLRSESPGDLTFSTRGPCRLLRSVRLQHRLLPSPFTGFHRGQQEHERSKAYAEASHNPKRDACANRIHVRMAGWQRWRAQIRGAGRARGR